MKKMKKRSVTLIEMMIVMFLIAMIIGVVAFNYRGSLDEGKAFKTKATIEKVETILTLTEAETGEDVVGRWREIVQQSPLVQRGSDFTKDAWGADLNVQRDSDNQIQVVSEKYNTYVKEHPGSMFR